MNTAPLQFIVITDTHYYSKKLGVDTPSYNAFNGRSQKMIKDSGEIIAAAFSQIAKSEIENVIICGDTTCDAEYDSHLEFIQMLYALKKCGKRIFAITSTHDFKDDGITYDYNGDIRKEIPSAKREELAAMYRDFGQTEAISVFDGGLSYIADLDGHYRLFALNSDKDGTGRSGYSQAMREWINKNAEQAKAEGKEIIAFTHHPLVSPSPFYSLIGKNDLMGGHPEIREMLADLGIELVFTGHTHIHDISYIFSEKGNVFYDVATTTLAGYPAYLRKVTATDDEYIIESENITEPVPIKFNGDNLQEHLADQFFGMIKRTLDSAASDTPEMAECLAGMSIKKKVSYRFGWLIKPIARMIKKLRIGTVYKLAKKESGLTPSQIEQIKDGRVFDFIIDLVMHLYSGDAPYTPDTPQYRITMGLCAIIDSIFKAIRLPFSKLVKGFDSVGELIEPLLYNKGICDKEARLPKRADKEAVSEICSKAEPVAITSRKGPFIVAVLILLILILIPFIPLIAIALGIGFLINRIKYSEQLREIK
ncbi:MAG: metallophosphoesterase [Clostridia bacterium]|nr:metallophosphoesterase [Clostridia bacterium]